MERTPDEPELWCDWQWDDPLGEARAALIESVAHIDALLAAIECGAWPA